MEKLLAEEATIPLPDVGDGLYLVNTLDEIGAALQSGMGLSPITWQEIKSWSDCTGMKLSPWELITLKEMSHAYAVELSQKQDRKRQAPWKTRVETKEELGNRLKAVFRSLKK